MGSIQILSVFGVFMLCSVVLSYLGAGSLRDTHSLLVVMLLVYIMAKVSK